MKKRALVVSGGAINDAFACDYIQSQNYDICIACDSGMQFYQRVGKKPDLILGDFDSVRPDVLDEFLAQPGIEWKRFPAEKDWTDTELAIQTALDLGVRQMDLFGATGSRLDHVLGNLSLLGYAHQNGLEICMIDDKNRIRLMEHELRIKRQEQFGTFVSLIPFMGAVKNLTLQGFKYNLEHADMDGFHSLGVSNEIYEQEAVISCGQGLLIVIESRD